MWVSIPDCSRDLRFLISKLSDLRLSVLKASAIDTASGSPSGIQTISNERAIYKFCRINETDSDEISDSFNTKSLTIQNADKKKNVSTAEI